MPHPLDTAPAVWDPATGRVYTFLLPDADGVMRSAWGHETFAEMVAGGLISPESEILPQPEAQARQSTANRSRLCRGPELITQERFDELLNVLPPARWTRRELTESFFVPEPITDALYTWVVRIKDCYFSLVEDSGHNHDSIVELCAAALV